MRNFVNFQTDLLRTFVTIIDLGNYTKTGKMLGRTQPAVSLQIKRLEQLCGAQLLDHSGKNMKLTAAGQTLIGYARDILRLNDRAVASLHQTQLLGTLRIGLPVDYSIEYFQAIITDFMQSNENVSVEIKCDWSRHLMQGLHVDDLDFVIAVTDQMPAPYVSLYWAERPFWVCGRRYDADPDKPIRIVAHPEGCFYRKRMIDSLSNEGREWHLTFESPGISAIQNAVLGGMGVTALTKKTLKPGMRVLSLKEGFPRLGNIHIGLFYKHIKMSDAALKLVEQLTDGIKAFQKPTSICPT